MRDSRFRKNGRQVRKREGCGGKEARLNERIAGGEGTGEETTERGTCTATMVQTSTNQGPKRRQGEKGPRGRSASQPRERGAVRRKGV